MPKPIVAPYGSWKSPITAEMLVSDSIHFMEIQLDGTDIYWIEGRPEERGRNVIVKRSADGQTTDMLPEPFNARTRVHEYGGGSFLVHEGMVFFSNYSDQRIYRFTKGDPPEPLTQEQDVRYADYIFDSARDRIIGVREDHREAAKEAVNAIVGISLHEDGEDTVLDSGRDFYSSPRLTPGGTHLAWLCWDHPNMPWDGTELWVAEVSEDGSLGERKRVAGGADESIFQPEWSPDGTLYFVSDRSQWWNIHRLRGEAVEAVHPSEAEFGMPQWVFGTSTYGFLSSEEILCCYTKGGVWKVGSIETDTLRFRSIDTPYTAIDALCVSSDSAVMIAGSPVEPESLLEWESVARDFRAIRRSTPALSLEGYTSVPEAIEFPTANGLSAHAFYYPPVNRDYEAPEGEKPPLIVIIHGGPTGATDSILSLKAQYWTSRGFALLDINYGGSTGFGREYRNRLEGAWGVVDVNDCKFGARYLVENRKADGTRLIIRGGSAGGYTTLAALAFHDVFKAGASYYGVSDLEVLAKETHKFESRYLDRLIGPYPERSDLYRERSPLHHLEEFSEPAIFLQGLEDEVVPPNQAEMMVDALMRKGVPVAYVSFEGEQHGFRQARNIVRATEAELYFYSRIFDFELPEAVEELQIFNL